MTPLYAAGIADEQRRQVYLAALLAAQPRTWWLQRDQELRGHWTEAERQASIRRSQLEQLAPQAPSRPRSSSYVRMERVRQATPAWADEAAIQALYAQARWLSRRTNVEHHVDHIVPIHGGTVCGLHVHYNLRVIPAADNVRRPRKWSEEG